MGVLRKQVLGLASISHLLDDASRANHLLGEQHYTDHIITPMVKSLFPVFDLIQDLLDPQAKDDHASDASREPLLAVRHQLEQFLGNYGIHMVKHEKGTPFDPKTMRPIACVQTDDKRLHQCLAESLQIGFQGIDQRVLRFETVSVFNCESQQGVGQ
jgi:molecular chaperone GrpE (heat shock protein)